MDCNRLLQAEKVRGAFRCKVMDESNPANQARLDNCEQAGADMDRRSLLKGAAIGLGPLWELSEIFAQPRQGSATTAQHDSAIDLERLRSARWDESRAFRYMQRFGEVKGCNYVPSDGSSILHQPDDALIKREIGWARDVVGLNSVRVWIDFADYQIAPEEVMRNFESFLGICEKNRLHVLPVLSIQQMLDPDYDAKASRADKPFMDFHPSVHGGGWRDPGRLHWPCCEPEGSISPETLAAWPKVRSSAEQFTRTVLSRYAKDERIILWDLYNEAPKAARPIVELIFQWAREVNPSQPLSVCWQGHDLSDVITFHTYARPGFETANRNSLGWDFLTELDWARAWSRPMLCTEWLARPFGNTIEAILPFYERYHVGWYVWGLCAVGPAQYQFPWGWPMGSPPPEKWFHCLLYPDGTPYSAEEVLLIRDFKYMRVAEQVKTQSYWRNWNLNINCAESYDLHPRASSITGVMPGYGVS